jgi:xanthosine utilization system XapX-like protein
MTSLRWLAVLPFLAILIGTAFVNTVEPLVFGLPLVLAWLVAWVVLTAVIMAVIFANDPANADAQDGNRGATR